MPVIYSPVASITTEPAQYLFRVYRQPITRTDVRRLEGADALSDFENPGVASGYELNYDDHLFSIPPTTEAIIDTANRLAFAMSLLCVGDAIPFVVVWLVESGKGIDRATPVTVLNPWQSRELRHRHDDYVQLRKQMAPGAEPQGPYRWTALEDVEHWDNAFKSYDLLPPDYPTEIPDAFVVLDVARATVRGRNRHQWFKNVLTKQDYFFNEKGQLFLTSFGSCSLARFPWFQATLEGMQWTHSGYDVTLDGRLILGNEALTERVANAAVDAAQMRRMFLRRSLVHKEVLRQWWHAMNALSYGLRQIEAAGWAGPAGHPAFPPDGSYVYWTQVPTWGVSYCLSAIVDFLNVLWIATGSNQLALWLPFTTFTTEEQEFTRISQLLFGQVASATWTPPYLLEDEDSPTHEIALAMQDLAASVLRVLWKYAATFQQLGDDHLFNRPPLSDTYLLGKAARENIYAEQYETVQGDLQAIMALMCSWQFAFHPDEPTRATWPTKLYKTKWEYQRIAYDFDQFEEQAAVGARFPDMSGRINDEVPVFAPPRTWAVTLINPQAANLYNEAKQRDQQAALAAARAAETARLEAAKAIRRAALQQQLEQLQSSTSLAGHPNPLDPYDWRNYMSKKWWLTPIAADDIPQFYHNMHDTPDAIDTAEDVFNLSPKVVNGLRRIEPLIDFVQDIENPHRVFRRALKNLTWKKVRKIVGDATLHYIEYKAKQDIDEIQKDLNPTPPTGFQPRDIWPDDQPLPDAPPPHQAVPVHTPPPYLPGSGGGTGGGGGGSLWDEGNANTYTA